MKFQIVPDMLGGPLDWLLVKDGVIVNFLNDVTPDEADVLANALNGGM